MQIEQVIGGVNGDTTAQAVQLRMRATGENFVAGGKLILTAIKAGDTMVTVEVAKDLSITVGISVLAQA